jgi:dethiobiotin synthetase
MTVRGLFVTGTNTGVGKTVVTRAVVRALVRRGLNVVALKPVESGVVGIPADAEALARAASRGHPIDAICRYQLKSPVSPHLAAKRDGVEIEKETVLQLIRDWTERAEIVIAEGAGGLLVPLTDAVTYADLISETDLRLLIVAPNLLGTINATLLTIEAAKSRNIDIAGVIFNLTSKDDLGNAEAVAQLGGVPILGEFPAVDEDDDDRLAEVAEENLDLDSLVTPT